MKRNIYRLIAASCVLIGALALSSCSQFLDRSPLDKVTPDAYFTTEADLAAYSITAYSFSAHGGNDMGVYNNDLHTDNAASISGSTWWWEKGIRQVAQSDATWSFSSIRNSNFFFEHALPKYEAGEISGSEANIDHYIGEMYFIRAWQYFSMLKLYGDFPIITEVLPNDQAVLTENLKRSPRNEVARFILSDLQKAEDLMQTNFANKNRIHKNIASLVMSRVALYEASWLKYHQGTAFVPGDANWPGKDKSYHAGFQYVAGSIDAEIDYFLDIAMEKAKLVADQITLTENTGVVNPNLGQYYGWNPYFEMFAVEDPSSISEVLMWKDYDVLFTAHNTSQFILVGGGNGTTKGLVDAHLMANGLPIYAAGSGYQGDSNLDIVQEGRDDRLKLFTFAASDVLSSRNETYYTVPTILNPVAGERDATGYRNRKYYSYDPIHSDAGTGGSLVGTTGCVLFRGVEAMLNYMEAQYMKDGAVDGTSAAYWTAIRARAGISTDYNATIAATDLSEEAKGDWGAYSAGTMVDATLYNIRRERRIELQGEGFRWADLNRWRALDQVQNYIIEGANFWEEIYQNDYYYDTDPDTGEKTSKLIDAATATDDQTPNVSTSSESTYLRPNNIIQANNMLYNGYNWTEAAYLYPLPVDQFVITSTGGDYSTSPLYQNPYWPIQAGMPALQ